MKLEGTKEHLSTSRGVFTRITLADGYTLTFVGPCGKAEGLRQAKYQRDKGTPSEVACKTCEGTGRICDYHGVDSPACPCACDCVDCYKWVGGGPKKTETAA